jgi:hypothetical protein
MGVEFLSFSVNIYGARNRRSFHRLIVDLPDARPEIAIDMGMAGLEIDQCLQSNFEA